MNMYYSLFSAYLTFNTTCIMHVYSTIQMTVMSIIIAIMAANSVALPTPNEFSAPKGDALFSPLNPETDRAAQSQLSVAGVNSYITSQIANMAKQNIKNVSIVQTQLTANLQRTYGDLNNWLVYVAQDFIPPPKNVSINYFGKGITGNIIARPWTVYWATTPRDNSDSLSVEVNEDAIQSKLYSCSSRTDGQLIASDVYQCIKNSLVFSGRSPIAVFLFLSSNPGLNVSLGNSLWLKRIFWRKITITCFVTVTINFWGHTITYTYVVHWYLIVWW